MLVITNGRVLVDPAMNAENMEQFIGDVTGNLNDLFEEEIVFEKIEDPFLMYKIPEGIAWKNILDARPPESRLEFMAIGKDDEVQLPYSQHKTVQHYYSVEELQEKAEKMTSLLDDIEKLEKEKKAVAKRLGEEIGELHDELKEVARSHRQKFEDRSMQVYVVMNFKERMKYYHKTSDMELVGSENMNDKDQRTLFDIKGYDPETFNEETITGFEIGTPEINDDEVEQELKDMEDNQNENENEKSKETSDDKENIDTSQATSMEEI